MHQKYTWGSQLVRSAINEDYRVMCLVIILVRGYCFNESVRSLASSWDGWDSMIELQIGKLNEFIIIKEVYQIGVWIIEYSIFNYLVVRFHLRTSKL